MELVAPAGDPVCLRAALEAGADAVYLGLPILNARRGAANFTAENLFTATRLAQERQAKIYLTLNTDITERETRSAAVALELAAQAGVAAVIVRDPLLLRLRPAFPELAWHVSTQASALNSADVAMLRDLGVQRVILGRELSLAEIADAAAVQNIEIEVFAQGALCFAISGKCLLSSWGGGMSGNRGLCRSLCRLPWHIVETGEERWPFSMCDLCALDYLPKLQAAGVKAIKIEGRLKNAAWVRDAVSIYRRALDGADALFLRREAEKLGAYAGRRMTSAYLEGCRTGLTAIAARPAAQKPFANRAIQSETENARGYRLEIITAGGEWRFSISYAERTETWLIKAPSVKRRARALSLDDFLAACREVPMQGIRLAAVNVDDPTPLLPPRVARGLRQRISAFLHACRKKSGVEVGVQPRAAALALLQRSGGASGDRILGASPDRVRLRAIDVERFLRSAERRSLTGIIVEEASDISSLKRLAGDLEICVALPSAFFEEDIAICQALVAEAAAHGATIEANTWAAVRLATSSRARWEAGPGLAVLNSTAAQFWKDLGAVCVCISCEASRKQIEDLCRRAATPLSLTVYGRPALAVTRAHLEDDLYDKTLADRRGIKLRLRRSGGMTLLRPLEPFSWLSITNANIKTLHIVVDLCGEEDPIAAWRTLPQQRGGFIFNYERGMR